MKVVAEHYTQQNIDWKTAKRIALVITDAFQKDFIRGEFYPKQYNLSVPLPDIIEYDELIAKARAFKALALSSARHLYLQIRSDNRLHAFLFKELEGTGAQSVRDVGLTIWKLPEYVHVDSKVSWIYRLKTWLLRIVFKIQDWWTFGRSGNPLLGSEMRAEFELGSVKCNVKDSPERVRELESLSGDELAKVAYPSSYNYSLGMFCVATAAQGKGYGRYIMDESIARLRQMTIQDPPNLRGPAKIGFFSAPSARPFYKKYGFSVGATWDHQMPSGRNLPHTYFFMNLT